MVVFLLNTEFFQILQGFQRDFLLFHHGILFCFEVQQISLKEQHGEPSVPTDLILLNEITSVARTHK